MRTKTNLSRIDAFTRDAGQGSQFYGVFNDVAENVVVVSGRTTGTLPVLSYSFRPRARHRFSVVAGV